ncbi:hypothetical protein [Paenibacillus piri]|nr:hypothetical protein [Paenibacillus piri]
MVSAIGFDFQEGEAIQALLDQGLSKGEDEKLRRMNKKKKAITLG